MLHEDVIDNKSFHESVTVSSEYVHLTFVVRGLTEDFTSSPRNEVTSVTSRSQSHSANNDKTLVNLLSHLMFDLKLSNFQLSPQLVAPICTGPARELLEVVQF